MIQLHLHHSLKFFIYLFCSLGLACAMHEYLHPADSLICSGIYRCGPEPTPKLLSEMVSPETERLWAEWWLVEISQCCTRVLCL